ncbi:uncharacterized membrane protein (DUF485 family) [Pedobacter sp. AK017]|uniref:glycosyltransferase family 39 protein n=1 Tax=Pedobacter sp. AK017 TaxID=2723073 RepID=UPI00161954FD|nr:glycosyltransferase family 39 protein [Pedobacter sp. AK017]MBB5436369.1 uncharacterized membrane protein (DUF485 family) [Pedobacter sp. AK017]
MTTKNPDKSAYILSMLIHLIVLAGISLRSFHFIYNRSLWMDEVYLCSTFIKTSYSHLATAALDYGQKAPIGFLWLVKLSVDLFGYTEMVLRSIPFIAGIVSILIFYQVCKYFLSKAGQIVALSIFCFAPALIYHSVEIKQYSMECLATVVALYLYVCYAHKITLKNNLCWGIFGALMIWFSFPIIFILAGIIGGISLNYLLKRDWKSLLPKLIPFSIWILSFAVNYFFFTKKHADPSNWVVYFFKTYDNFMPFPPHSAAELKWYPRNYLQMLDYPLGLIWNFKETSSNSLIVLLQCALPSIVLFSGIYSLYKKNIQFFYVLTFPIVLMFLASGLLLYPIIERFWVFISPIFILFIAYGFEFYRQKIKLTYGALILVVAIVASPVMQSIYYLAMPIKFYKHKKSFMKEALLNVNDHFKQGDVVYNYWNNAPGYKVYQHILNLKYTAIQGQDFRKTARDHTDYNQKLNKDFTKFKGKKRVWLIYNKQFLTDIGDKIDDPDWYYKTNVSPGKNLFNEFNKIGKPVWNFVYSDITIYLFEIEGF